MLHSRKKIYIKSGNDNIYIEIGYPAKETKNAIVVAHGLRSYYTGFLDKFAKKIREAGYISIKFHFLGTGKSSGLFEDKLTNKMLRNYTDVIRFLVNDFGIKNIGIVGRSNAGAMAIMHGPHINIKAYVLLAPPIYYSLSMKKFVEFAEIKDEYFYHKSFKRQHTNGVGRLPLIYLKELKKFDKVLLENVKKIKPVILFQSTKDEAVALSEGHYDYCKINLPSPNKLVLIDGSNHSYKGYKDFVINESIGWFNKYLPL